ncbi:antho-rfamide neuropeptides type 2 [Plakobranchus ocellatus]|uniref:Antho-rfamide neuropeptides type 2 n=1 Tax=Plakobranchus ocellatus TaxID=259542 RepID=A0AAV3XWW2_9GAST|nr:antho-rfamide neuropeptides type 2 [Plakobranchus ocellatus]
MTKSCYLLLVSGGLFLLLLSLCDAFSKGSLLVNGNTAARRMYCHRPALHRPPLHVEKSCGGTCTPENGAEFYSIDLHVDDASYWLNGFDLTLRAQEDSEYSVTGFSVVAVDEMGTVVGVFTGSDDDIVVGTCEGVLQNAVEGHFAVHAHAQHGRKNVTVTWTPDGYNHETVKFHAWIVHNHSSIFYLKSEEINSKKHGSTTLDVDTIFQELMGNALANMNDFEQTFDDRQTRGYNIDLDDPFQPFNEDPSQTDLVPGFGEVEANHAPPGWLSSYSRMLTAIDEGGVFKWSEVMKKSRGDLGSLALGAILDDVAYDSGLIDVDFDRFGNFGNGAGKGSIKPSSVDNKGGSFDINNADNITNEETNSANSGSSLEPNETSTFMGLNKTLLTMTNVTDNKINGFPKDGGKFKLHNNTNSLNITDDLTNSRTEDVEQSMTANVSDDSVGKTIVSVKEEDLSADRNETDGFLSLGNLMNSEANKRIRGSGNASTSDLTTLRNETAGDLGAKDFMTDAEEASSLLSDHKAFKSAATNTANRVKRQSSRSPSRKPTPPPWAMGPQMARPSSPGSRGPPPSRSNTRRMPSRDPRRNGGRPPPGRSGNPFGGNPSMRGAQFPVQGGPNQNFRSPMGQQFPPGMMPQQFPGGSQGFGGPNSQQFGFPPGGQRGENPFGPSSQSPFGQPRQNPFGQTSQNPFGQSGQNPLRQPSQNPFGQPGQTPFGQPGQNPLGQPNQNPFGQPNQNPFGQPSQNPFGQPGQNSFGQQRQNAFGQPSQNPFGQPNQNPFGQPSRNPFGQNAPNSFGQPNQNPFGQQRPFGPQDRNPFGSTSSFPVPQGIGGQNPDALGPGSQPPPSLPTESDDGGEELELKPSPFESLGSFSLGPSGPSPFSSSSSNSGQMNPFETPRMPNQGQMNGQLGRSQGFPGAPPSMGFNQPSQMMNGNPFAQQQNPFGGQFGGFSGNSFGQMPGQFGFQGNMPGMPPQPGQMDSMPGMPPSMGQNGFGNQQGMPFMGGNQFGSGRNPFAPGSNSNSMFRYPSMSNPFHSSSSSPFGRSFGSMMNPFRSPLAGMGNPLSRRGSFNPFSSPFSSTRGGFPGMMDMRGMPGLSGGRPMGMGGPTGGFPTRSIGSRSRSRS